MWEKVELSNGRVCLNTGDTAYEVITLCPESELTKTYGERAQKIQEAIEKMKKQCIEQFPVCYRGHLEKYDVKLVPYTGLEENQKLYIPGKNTSTIHPNLPMAIALIAAGREEWRHFIPVALIERTLRKAAEKKDKIGSEPEIVTEGEYQVRRTKDEIDFLEESDRDTDDDDDSDSDDTVMSNSIDGSSSSCSNFESEDEDEDVEDKTLLSDNNTKRNQIYKADSKGNFVPVENIPGFSYPTQSAPYQQQQQQQQQEQQGQLGATQSLQNAQNLSARVQNDIARRMEKNRRNEQILAAKSQQQQQSSPNEQILARYSQRQAQQAAQNTSKKPSFTVQDLLKKQIELPPSIQRQLDQKKQNQSMSAGQKIENSNKNVAASNIMTNNSNRQVMQHIFELRQTMLDALQKLQALEAQCQSQQ